MSRYQSHAPQENIAGSEGLLIGVRAKNGIPLWPTFFHKHRSHRVLTTVIYTGERTAFIIHNVYCPNKGSEHREFMKELQVHSADIIKAHP